jgi:CRP-like cAMP-binding protein
VAAADPSPSRTERQSIRQFERQVADRRAIWREQDLHDVVPVICSGWAAATVVLSNGRRQIVSFLLPGDMVSSTSLFDSRLHCRVEAITDVRVRAFDRSALQSLIHKQPDVLETFAKVWGAEKAQAEEMIVDLGRRTAEERIARLILSLMERLERRGIVHSKPVRFEFPFRQHHVADATGLTSVHVSRVLNEFRKAGQIEISNRTLTILDPSGFRRVAQGH